MQSSEEEDKLEARAKRLWVALGMGSSDDEALPSSKRARLSSAVYNHTPPALAVDAGDDGQALPAIAVDDGGEFGGIAGLAIGIIGLIVISIWAIWRVIKGIMQVKDGLSFSIVFRPTKILASSARHL